MRVLILCIGNSCRSQMVHGFLQSFSSDFEVHSAGTKPAEGVNPKAIEVMKEVGIDLSIHSAVSSKVGMSKCSMPITSRASGVTGIFFVDKKPLYKVTIPSYLQYSGIPLAKENSIYFDRNFFIYFVYNPLSDISAVKIVQTSFDILRKKHYIRGSLRNNQ